MTGRRGPGPQRIKDPSPFQLRMLMLVAEGHTDAEITALVKRSENAVHTGLSAVYRKLGARNRTQAVVIAMRRGLIPLHPPTDTTT